MSNMTYRRARDFVYADEWYPVYDLTFEGKDLLRQIDPTFMAHYDQVMSDFHALQRKLSKLHWTSEIWRMPKPAETPAPYPYEKYDVIFDLNRWT